MALTPSGAISMSDINVAMNRSSTTAISFNDNGPRCIANADTGAVSMSAMRGKQVASGTIAVVPSSATNKGVTTDYYGLRSGFPTTVTLGNLTTIPFFTAATGFNAFYGAKARNVSTYNGVFNVLQTSTSGAAPSFRIKVGSNASAAFTFQNFVGNTTIFNAGTLSVVFIGPADVYTTPTWVLST